MVGIFLLLLIKVQSIFTISTLVIVLLNSNRKCTQVKLEELTGSRMIPVSLHAVKMVMSTSMISLSLKKPNLEFKTETSTSLTHK